MKRIVLGFIIALCAVSLSYAGSVKRFIKIGYVDVEEVFDQYPGTDDIREKLKEEKQKYSQEIDTRKEKIARAEKDFQDNYDRLSEEERQRREAEIEYQKEQLSEFIDDANKKLEAMKEQLTSPVYAKIITVIRNVSAEKGYSFVFRKSSNALLYQDKEFDLTRDVVYRLQRELQLQQRN